jgi:hypothetical protein
LGKVTENSVTFSFLSPACYIFVLISQVHLLDRFAHGTFYQIEVLRAGQSLETRGTGGTEGFKQPFLTKPRHKNCLPSKVNRTKQHAFIQVF